MDLTILFIAHNLAVVKYFSDRIGVMHFGTMVELADADELYAHPVHPYTKSLLSAIPSRIPTGRRTSRGFTMILPCMITQRNSPVSRRSGRATLCMLLIPRWNSTGRNYKRQEQKEKWEKNVLKTIATGDMFITRRIAKRRLRGVRGGPGLHHGA